ncbi:class I SAM-dependent methyltransferase [Nocardia rhamnosiphila]|uniref:class I SAM-dependent methyltransferase n=1 Tax=Nocardia rhamnosiphila TaxID=426716 RepID=UPI0033D7BD06
MVTLPPEPPSSLLGKSHHARGLAQSFGDDPERYDRTRPRYPAAMVARVIAEAPGRDVLDVGIGTGISAQPFAAAGCRVLGVEVDPRMAEFAARQGFDVEVAKFEDWDPAGRDFDAVVSGQSWHWVDPVRGATKAAQVLRPGGRLAVFWNAFAPPADLAQAFGAVYQRLLPGSPFARGPFGGPTTYAGQFTEVGDGMRRAGAFETPEQWEFAWTRRFTRDEWLEQVPTFGGHSQFSPDTLERLLAGIGSAVDDAGGSFVMNYTTVVITAPATGRNRPVTR